MSTFLGKRVNCHSSRGRNFTAYITIKYLIYLRATAHFSKGFSVPALTKQQLILLILPMDVSNTQQIPFVARCSATFNLRSILFFIFARSAHKTIQQPHAA